jgi:hypothetical protein
VSNPIKEIESIPAPVESKALAHVTDSFTPTDIKESAAASQKQAAESTTAAVKHIDGPNGPLTITDSAATAAAGAEGAGAAAAAGGAGVDASVGMHHQTSATEAGAGAGPAGGVDEASKAAVDNSQSYHEATHMVPVTEIDKDGNAKTTTAILTASETESGRSAGDTNSDGSTIRVSNTSAIRADGSVENVNVTTMPDDSVAKAYDESIGETYQPQQFITITNPFGN